jgi:hypothetical protein
MKGVKMGRRIINYKKIQQTKTQPTGVMSSLANKEEQKSGTEQYWERLKNLIPTEVTAIYIALQGTIPTDQKWGLLGWSIFCLILTTLYTARETKTTAEPKTNPQVKPSEFPIDWAHVAVSSASFVIWVYALGNVFSDFGIYVSWIGTLLVVAWTALVPFIWQGSTASPKP